MITTNYQSVVPAYGRDYKNAAAARSDFLAGMDFEQRVFPPVGGTYCSINDFAKGVIVNVRYDKQQRVVPVVVL